jgi:ergothioneine biosynthesis protein EgtB
MIVTGAALSRSSIVERYRRNRGRSRALFDLVSDEAYYRRPIAWRHPIAFYEGHLPAFAFNTLAKRALGRPSIDARFETLFARGIDPDESATPVEMTWPARKDVLSFADEVDRQLIDLMEHADCADAVFTVLEHEAMHQETLLYMWHRLPFADKKRPRSYTVSVAGGASGTEWIDVPGGIATLGTDPESIPFGWDNEFPRCTAEVPDFAIERHDATNGRFLEFVDAGGYRSEQWWAPQDWRWLKTEGRTHPLFWESEEGTWFWRGMFERVPLPLTWPVYVSLAEAAAFARWSGTRLPTEAEFQRAAYGAPDGERPYPWGSDAPAAHRGVFDFSSWEPEPVGSHPSGASAWGIEDLVGNGWEWTGSIFAPFPGFRPMASYPEYSADFFDGEHFVMKGASPATARELLRPTFRNWFRARYPYVYATFRCVRNQASRP